MSSESSESPQSSPLHCEVRYRRPQVAISIRRDVSYSSVATDGRLMDIYAPDAETMLRSAIVIASGYPAAGLKKYAGGSARQLPATTSWAQLLASEGVVVIAYDAVDPTRDLETLLAYLRTEGGRLGIDANRLGVIASSGNGPVALAAVAVGGVQCAILLYAFTLDGPDSSIVETASRQFGFANPSARVTVDDVPSTTSLMIVRAGRDAFPGSNETLDRFAADAMRSNLAITIVNHATGSHAFDLLDSSRESHHVIRQVLAYARRQLLE